MKKQFSILVSAMLFSVASLVAQTSVWDGSQLPFTNGTGTQSDPYLIESAANLAHLAYLVNNGIGAGSGNIVGQDIYYKMTINVDLNGSQSFQWTPIGYYNSFADFYYFGGHFDGNGKTIANLFINSTTLQRAGLFGMMNGGSIKNVGVTGNGSVTITGTGIDGSAAGGIVAYCTGTTIFDNVSNTGNVSSTTMCYYYYSTYYSYSGGIIGHYEETTGTTGTTLTISNCYNTGNVSASVDSYSSYSSSYSGGILGYYRKATGTTETTLTISNCYNTGNVSAYTLPSSANTHDGAAYSGGIVGHNEGAGTLAISNCYNTGNVFVSDLDSSYLYNYSFQHYSGGIVGCSKGTLTISSCYNTGKVSTSSTTFSTSYSGGVVGYTESTETTLTISNCYNMGDVSATAAGSSVYSGGVVGYQATSSTLIINNCHNMGNISTSTSTSHLPSYSGGIAGCLSGGTISSCYNTGNVFSSSYSAYSGGMAGSGTLIINNCYNMGNISAYAVVDYGTPSSSGGGMTGGTGTITNCYNMGNVTATGEYSPYYSYSSFSCGIGSGTITNCYNRGNLSSAGIGSGTITNCYNTGTSFVAIGGATVTNCYYLSAYSNNNGNGSIPKTEDFMKSDEMVTLLGNSFLKDTEPYKNWGYPILADMDFSVYVKTEYAKNILQNKATLQGSYYAGTETITAKGFEYKSDSESTFTIVNVSGNDLVYNLTGLTSNTYYQFRAFLKLGQAETLYGETLSFRTHADNIPWNGADITPVTPELDTYYIYSPSELAWIAQECNGGNAFYARNVVLMDHLDLGGALFTPSQWKSIGYNGTFSGNFDGGHYIINNLYITTYGESSGLFGTVSGGIIKNVILHNVNIVCSSSNVGGVVGRFFSSNMENCYVTGSIAGPIEGDVQGNVGGLIGYMTGGNLSNLCFSGSILSGKSVGGLIGSVYATTPVVCSNSYVIGNLNNSEIIGGLIGSGSANSYNNAFTISNCYNTAILSANSGGIIGTRGNFVNINNCFFDRQMAGVSQGVAVGEQTGAVSKSTSEMTAASSFGMEGGVDWIYTAGLYPQLSVFANHNNQDIQTLSKLSVAPIFLENGETSAKVSKNFTVSTANSVTWSSSHSNIIGINGNAAAVKLPILETVVSLNASLNGMKKTVPLTVPGADTIYVYSKTELLEIANACNSGYTYKGKYIKLMNDIVLEENVPNNILAIGNYETNRPFMGTFDGNGKVILNVYIDKPNSPYQGFFGYTKDAKLDSVGLVNIIASGRDYTGGMVAYAENTYMRKCYVNGGDLHALTYVGGLVGFQSPGTGDGANSIISGCWNACRVSANKYVGGLVGYSDESTVRNSYVKAKVVGADTATTGGIIGGAYKVLMYHSWFSKTLTGQTKAIGQNTSKDDEGLSDEEMQTQEFVDMLNTDLTSLAWRMDYDVPINDKFPILIWQRPDLECGAPANLMVNEVGATQVTLSWQGGSNDHYLVEYTKSGGTPQTQTTKDNAITLTGLESYCEYTWRVKSVCTYGESDFVQGAKFVTGGVSIEHDSVNDRIIIYPNPTSGEVRVESGALRVESVEIFDVMGKNVSRLTSHISHPISIDISYLPSGVYFLRIVTENEVVTKKIIKR